MSLRAGFDLEFVVRDVPAFGWKRVQLSKREVPDADLVLLSGDPFDAQTNVERVVISGKVVWTRAKKTRS